MSNRSARDKLHPVFLRINRLFLIIMTDTMTSLVHIAGNTTIRFTETDPAWLKVDAIVEEQDTSLILGRSPVIMDSIESFPALIKKMEYQIQEIPGNVLVRQSTPKRFIAIVYNIDHTPICRQDWVKQAFDKILRLCEKSGIRTLAIPLLGTSYGKLKQETVLHMLQDLLIQRRRDYPKKILIYKISYGADQ